MATVRYHLARPRPTADTYEVAMSEPLYLKNRDAKRQWLRHDGIREDSYPPPSVDLEVLGRYIATTLVGDMEEQADCQKLKPPSRTSFLFYRDRSNF